MKAIQKRDTESNTVKKEEGDHEKEQAKDQPDEVPKGKREKEGAERQHDKQGKPKSEDIQPYILTLVKLADDLRACLHDVMLLAREWRVSMDELREARPVCQANVGAQKYGDGWGGFNGMPPEERRYTTPEHVEPWGTRHQIPPEIGRCSQAHAGHGLPSGEARMPFGPRPVGYTPRPNRFDGGDPGRVGGASGDPWGRERKVGSTGYRQVRFGDFGHDRRSGESRDK
jgi:hypothetical protein